MTQPAPVSTQSPKARDAYERLDALEKRVAELEKTIRALRSALGAATGSVHDVPSVAPPSDLDSQWGDEEIKFNPRDWQGASFKGHRMSECPAEFLDMLAASFEFFASQADEKGEMVKGRPKSIYERRRAARARGWAARIRAGWVSPVANTASRNGGRPAWMDATPDGGIPKPTPEELAEDQLPF